MNEKRIQQVMDIEKEAQRILDAARRDAANLPLEAEREAQEIADRTRADARAQAKKILVQAGAQDESERILAAVDQKIRASEDSAKKNQERAVSFVLDKVLGKA